VEGEKRSTLETTAKLEIKKEGEKKGEE